MSFNKNSCKNLNNIKNNKNWLKLNNNKNKNINIITIKTEMMILMVMMVNFYLFQIIT